VFLLQLLFDGQPKQQQGQPQGNLVQQQNNFKVLWKLRVAVSAENVGEFVVRPVVILGEGVCDVVVGSSEPLAVFLYSSK
jgi:hypothetical protein